jgi:hypothetical protein
MTLKLTLNKKWFDMIASGEKKEEYREIKPYWIVRLTNQKEKWVRPLSFWKFANVDTIVFKNGYSKDAPTILVECKGISIGNAKPEWSDNWEGGVFVIQLGEIIEIKK